MAGFFTRHPGFALVTSLTILKLFAQLPCLLVYYLPSYSRPVKSWTLGQALGRKILRIWFEYAAVVEFRMPFNLDAGKEKERFVVIQPDDSHDIYQDVLLATTNITPVAIGAVWHPKPLSAPDQHVRGRRVFLHFHGGAYVLSGCRDTDVAFAASLLLRSPGALALFPQYRLSSYPGNKYPAAFQDAVTAYAHLVFALQVPPSNIILSGDSAGGNLAIALLRYITMHKELLPEPAGLLLWSPWVDLSVSTENLAKRPNYNTDFIPANLIRWADRVFLPPGNEEYPDPRQDPYISPLKKPLATSVPIFVQWGGREILQDDSIAFAKRQKDASQEAGGRLGGSILRIPKK
ncbi:hypothetical protein N0V82_008529 [Gnomoniopsis sp. IMI 355080]|nr:hypothetical protein N0V82_008529 [Gnomoniopsis sp. IMI 355080]